MIYERVRQYGRRIQGAMAQFLGGKLLCGGDLAFAGDDS